MESSLAELSKRISPDHAVVVDPNFEWVGLTPWDDVVTSLINKRAYTVLERADGRVVRSPNLELSWPLVVSQFRGSNGGGRPAYKTMDLDTPVSNKKHILRRDGYICQYCGEHGDTIDHVIPKSRLPKGKANYWGNLVAACSPCNNKKDNKTPQEAGMKVPKIKPGVVRADKDDNGIMELVIDALREAVA